MATGDERHELGLVAVDAVHEMLGRDAQHSVSHTTAVSIVIGVLDQPLGIDLERLAPARPRIAERVLTAREQNALGPAPEWPMVLRCFCIKEAVYKVLDPAHQQNLRFRGLELAEPSADTTRVETEGAPRAVALAAAARGEETLVAIAAPLHERNRG